MLRCYVNILMAITRVNNIPDGQYVVWLYVLVNVMFWLTRCLVFICISERDVLTDNMFCVYMCYESVICCNGKWYVYADKAGGVFRPVFGSKNRIVNIPRNSWWCISVYLCCSLIWYERDREISSMFSCLPMGRLATPVTWKCTVSYKQSHKESRSGIWNI